MCLSCETMMRVLWWVIGTTLSKIRKQTPLRIRPQAQTGKAIFSRLTPQLCMATISLSEESLPNTRSTLIRILTGMLNDKTCGILIAIINIRGCHSTPLEISFESLNIPPIVITNVRTKTVIKNDTKNDDNIYRLSIFNILLTKLNYS